MTNGHGRAYQRLSVADIHKWQVGQVKAVNQTITRSRQRDKRDKDLTITLSLLTRIIFRLGRRAVIGQFGERSSTSRTRREKSHSRGER